MTGTAHAPDHTAHYLVTVPEPDDFDFWRETARRLVQCRVHPEQVSWAGQDAPGSLFAAAGNAIPDPPDDAPAVQVNRRFLGLARNAALHSDPERFALLYRLLWRQQVQSRLLEDKADSDVRRIEDLDRAVRCDSHKMHAFVRFRLIADGPNEGERYVAWFEPDHHIVRANAGFFIRRFANMNWSILTPRVCLHWDQQRLVEGPPASRSDAPQGDPIEDLWRTYYASTFNPARLKVGAMLKEMPRRYWKNMPETALIPQLIAGAQAREHRMVSAGERADEASPDSIPAIAREIDACRRCPIGNMENRAVMGEGPLGAQLMIVGEQPGDQEDEQGRPFVGPAGQLLDVHLAQAGIDRTAAYVTNTVKHFKFEQRGKRRLHQSPTAKEIDICRWWIESERLLVKSKVVLALGASAARGMLGKTISVGRSRGVWHRLDDGSDLLVTVHPAYLLRLDGEARVLQEGLFRADLAAVSSRLQALV